jgi:hypothetical protein
MATKGAAVEKTLGVGGNVGRGIAAGKITYGDKGMIKSRRLDADINNSIVRNLERGGYVKRDSKSSLAVRKYEIIGGKKFAVVS